MKDLQQIVEITKRHRSMTWERHNLCYIYLYGESYGDDAKVYYPTQMHSKSTQEEKTYEPDIDLPPFFLSESPHIIHTSTSASFKLPTSHLPLSSPPSLWCHSQHHLRVLQTCAAMLSSRLSDRRKVEVTAAYALDTSHDGEAVTDGLPTVSQGRVEPPVVKVQFSSCYSSVVLVMFVLFLFW